MAFGALAVRRSRWVHGLCGLGVWCERCDVKLSAARSESWNFDIELEKSHSSSLDTNKYSRGHIEDIRW